MTNRTPSSLRSANHSTYYLDIHWFGRHWSGITVCSVANQVMLIADWPQITQFCDGLKVLVLQKCAPSNPPTMLGYRFCTDFVWIYMTIPWNCAIVLHGFLYINIELGNRKKYENVWSYQNDADMCILYEKQ